MKKKLSICIDIDGTMTDPYYFMPYFNHYFKKNLSFEDCTTHRIDKLYKLSREQIEKFYKEVGRKMHLEATLMENVNEVLEELMKEHELHIVTARSKEMEDITLKWIEDNNVPRLPLHSLGSYYKVDVAKELKCDYFIEDNPENSKQLAEAGIHVILIDNNYNKNLNGYNITRVKDWIEIKEFIEKVSNL